MLRYGLITLALGGTGPGDGAFLKPAASQHKLDPHFNLARVDSLDKEYHSEIRFVGGQGIFGEAIPPSNRRHPCWRFEAYHLAKYRAYTCCVALFVAGVLCAAGGIGGGGIYVSLLMVAGKLGVTDAVPLSKAIVFFGSLSSWVLNSRKLVSWETKRETAIDYNICRLVVPGSLIGTLLGVILNRRLPSWIILAVLVVILVAITVSVTWTSLRQYAQEQAEDLEEEQEEAAAAAKAAKQGEIAQKPPSSRPGGVRFQDPPYKSGAAAGDSSLQGVLQRGLTNTILRPRRPSRKRRPSMNAPDISKLRNKVLKTDVFLCLAMLFVVITAGVLRFHVSECLKAGAAVQQRICGHPTLFWLGAGTLESWRQHSSTGHIVTIFTIAGPICLCAAVEFFYMCALIRYEGWHPWEVLVYCLLAIFTGCLSGLVGIGGGLIFAPFFLLTGVHPSVAVATSSTCVIFTSASTSLQYLLTDRIIVSLTLVYGAVSLVASYLGTSFVHFLEERFWGRKSYVSFIVGMGVLISTVLCVFKLFN
mmetsp:Transcript_83297/g.193507  ORF Transcript_83297/g.193507 Transcript_83297/m.193507 type:complete len:532 (+) Transcript_83297:69-1664(+)